MEEDGQGSAYRQFIVPASGTVRFAKSLDRSVTGSMNELIREAKYWLEVGELSPHEVGGRLNGTLRSVLAPSKKDGYGRPREVFGEMVRSAGSAQPSLASIESDVFGAISGFHKKIMTVLRESSLDDDKLTVVSERVKTLLGNVTAEMKQTKKLKVAEWLEGAYSDIKRLVDDLSKSP